MKPPPPLVSVVVTCYNVEEYIEQALKSLQDQSYSHFEAIVIDDASTDSTGEKAKKIAEDDERITVFTLDENTPGGAGPPSNIGLAKAKGKYVTFLDGDDYLVPYSLSSLVESAEDHDADVTISNYKNVEDSTDRIIDPPDANLWPLAKAALESRDFNELRKIILRFNSVPWRKLYLRSFVEGNDLRFPEGDFFYEDNPLHWQSTLAANRISLVDRDLFFHRVAREGQTTSGNETALFKMFVHHNTIWEQLCNHPMRREYSPLLLIWLTCQTEWISQRASDEKLEELFETVKPCFDKHDRSDIKKALIINEHYRRPIHSLWMACKYDEFEVFRDWVHGGELPKNLKYKGRYFLDKYGVLNTLLKTTGKKHDSPPTQISANQHSEIERRLHVIEKQLGDLEKTMTALFIHLEDINNNKYNDD